MLTWYFMSFTQRRRGAAREDEGGTSSAGERRRLPGQPRSIPPGSGSAASRSLSSPGPTRCRRRSYANSRPGGSRCPVYNAALIALGESEGAPNRRSKHFENSRPSFSRTNATSPPLGYKLLAELVSDRLIINSDGSLSWTGTLSHGSRDAGTLPAPAYRGSPAPTRRRFAPETRGVCRWQESGEFRSSSPRRREADCLGKLHGELRAVCDPLPYNFEFIFVDDGSTDETATYSPAARGDQRVRYLEMSRNFGHQAALSAGVAFAGGDAVIMMDGDLQYPAGR